MTEGEIELFADRMASELERMRLVEKLCRDENARLRLELQTAKYDASLWKDKLTKSNAKVQQADEAGKRALMALKEQETLILELQEEIERYRLREQLR